MSINKNRTRIENCLSIISLVIAGFFAITVNGQSVILNEVEADAPDAGTQFSCQYVELRGTVGATVAAGTYFVSINGASGSFGDVSFIVGLGGRVFGSNGTITIINELKGTCPNRVFPSGTTIVSVQDFDGLGLIDAGARTFAVISAPTAPQPGDDLDTNNDRVIDPSNGVSLIDGIGMTTNALFQAVYAPNVFDAAVQGAPGSILLPDAYSRFACNATPRDGAAWYFGELASSPAETTVYSGLPRNLNFPVAGALTPGAPNTGQGKAFADFNCDGRTDFSVTRNQGGMLNWYTALNGSDLVRFSQWGVAGDVAVAEDFDGDGNDDLAIWRTGGPAVAAFYILQSANNTFRLETFGQANDVPTVAGDWDGDGKSDPAVFRGSTGTFYYRGSNNNPGGDTTYLVWGQNGDRPVRGDYDGDGKLDAGVFRPSNGTWYVRQSTTGNAAYDYFGLATDIFVNADYDGDGKTDLASYRDGVWWIKQSSNAAVVLANHGLPGDSVVPGDYDGDGRSDFAVWRAGVFYVSTSSGSTIYNNFGLVGDTPTASSFVY